MAVAGGHLDDREERRPSDVTNQPTANMRSATCQTAVTPAAREMTTAMPARPTTTI
jgi:hypothetical protein